MTDESISRIIRKPELLKRVGVSWSTIDRMEKAGNFPRRIKLGSNAVGWDQVEIEQWLMERKKDRN